MKELSKYIVEKLDLATTSLKDIKDYKDVIKTFLSFCNYSPSDPRFKEGPRLILLYDKKTSCVSFNIKGNWNRMLPFIDTELEWDEMFDGVQRLFVVNVEKSCDNYSKARRKSINDMIDVLVQLYKFACE